MIRAYCSGNVLKARTFLVSLLAHVKVMKIVFQDTLMVADPETRKPCRRQVFLFEQLMIFSEPFERKLDWTVYIYRHSIKVPSTLYSDHPLVG